MNQESREWVASGHCPMPSPLLESPSSATPYLISTVSCGKCGFVNIVDKTKDGVRSLLGLATIWPVPYSILRPVQRTINEPLYLQQKRRQYQEPTSAVFSRKVSTSEAQETQKKFATEERENNEAEEKEKEKETVKEKDSERRTGNENESGSNIPESAVRNEKVQDNGIGTKRCSTIAASSHLRKKPRIDGGLHRISVEAEFDAALAEAESEGLCSPSHVAIASPGANEDFMTLYDPASYDEDFQFLAEMSFKERCGLFSAPHVKMLQALYSDELEASNSTCVLLFQHLHNFIAHQQEIIVLKTNVNIAGRVWKRGERTITALQGHQCATENDLNVPAILTNILCHRYSRMGKLLGHFTEPFQQFLAEINGELLRLYDAFASHITQVNLYHRSDSTPLFETLTFGLESLERVRRRVSEGAATAEMKSKITLWRLLYKTVSACCLE